MKNTGKKKIILLIAGILPVLIISVSPGIIRQTSTTGFCKSCHVMEGQYESWFLTGMHRRITCVDCHLPNDHIAHHLIWKAIDGIKDVIFFYGRLFSDPIIISEHGKKTVQGNCIRCHEDLVSRITVQENKCWSCHRQVNHKFPSPGAGRWR